MQRLWKAPVILTYEFFLCCWHKEALEEKNDNGLVQ